MKQSHRKFSVNRNIIFKGISPSNHLILGHIDTGNEKECLEHTIQVT